MRLDMVGSTLAFFAGAVMLSMPVASEAGNVGVYGACSGGSKTLAITQAGHTPVTIDSLDAGSLGGLAGLIVESCGGYVPNAQVTTAVANGMFLVINDWGQNPTVTLPGVTLSAVNSPGNYINLAAGSPIATGPGGTLNDSSLDGGHSSYHTYFMSLPIGATPLLTTDTSQAQVTAFWYAHGSGRVAYSGMPVDHYLPGAYPAIAPGILTYMTNLVACGLDAECAPPVPVPATTCASEGYTGTKLTWCRNICEMGYTGATLDSWIHRWVNKYRELPYCAADTDGESQPLPK